MGPAFLRGRKRLGSGDAHPLTSPTAASGLPEPRTGQGKGLFEPLHEKAGRTTHRRSSSKQARNRTNIGKEPFCCARVSPCCCCRCSPACGVLHATHDPSPRPLPSRPIPLFFILCGGGGGATRGNDGCMYVGR